MAYVLYISEIVRLNRNSVSAIKNIFYLLYLTTIAANNFRSDKYFMSLCIGQISKFVKIGQQYTELCMTSCTYFCAHLERNVRVNLLNISWIDYIRTKMYSKTKHTLLCLIHFFPLTSYSFQGQQKLTITPELLRYACLVELVSSTKCANHEE
jgi:hypothetical protein